MSPLGSAAHVAVKRRRPPAPPPPASDPLLGDPAFNPASPTWRDGSPITGDALAAYQGLVWWADEANWPQHTGGSLSDIALEDDLYDYARPLRARLQALIVALSLTRDLRFLDAVAKAMDLTASKLAIGYRGHDPAVVTWQASPYRMWPNRGGGFGADVTGTDLVPMNEVKWHSFVAQAAWAFHVNRGNASPGGLNYAQRADFWKDYLVNDFVPKWRGGGTTGWRDRYRGRRRTPTYSTPHARAAEGEWPIVVNGGEGHSSLSSTHLAFYMHLLTGEQSARAEFEWMSNAWLTTDSDIVNGTHRIYYHTSPAQGSSATYAQRSAYVDYNQMDVIVARVLSMWPERFDDTVLTQMARSLNDWFFLPTFLTITDSGAKGSYGDIVGEVPRGKMTSNPDTGRIMSQLYGGHYLTIARWAPQATKDRLTHLESFSGVGTRANPKVPFLNSARLLMDAPLDAVAPPPPTGASVLAFTNVQATYATATSIAKAMPSVQAGDTVFAAVMHRSALTPPAGWTLLRTQDVGAGSPVFQTLSVYYHTVQVGDPGTYTWTQATSGRMGVMYLATRGSQGAVEISQVASNGAYDMTTPTHDHALPSVNVTVPGSRVLAFATDSYSATTGGTWQTPSGWTLHEPNGQGDNRLSMMSRQVDQAGAVSSVTFTHAIGDEGVRHAAAHVMVVVAPAEGQTVDEAFIAIQAEDFI